jgi:hypothetical protein
MLISKLTCPVCNARLKSARTVRPEKTIRCPRCSTHFSAALALGIDPAPKPSASPAALLPAGVQPHQQDSYGSGCRVRASESEPVRTNQRNPIRCAALLAAAVVVVVGAGLALTLASSRTWQPKPAPAQPVAQVEPLAPHVERIPTANPQASPRTSESVRPKAKSECTPILLAGTPPLAQNLVDHGRNIIEWALDVRLTEQQRREYEQLFINDWQKLSQAAKDKSIADSRPEVARRLLQLQGYQRDSVRGELQPDLLARLRNKADSAICQWWLAVYESAHKPGGERNAVLVPGSPALTQRMVNQYGDFIEWALDLRMSGGLTATQRQQLRAMVVRDWKGMERSDKEDFVQFLENWTAIAQLKPAERTQRQQQFLPEFLDQLRGATDHEPSQWLLKLHGREQELVKHSASAPAGTSR